METDPKRELSQFFKAAGECLAGWWWLIPVDAKRDQEVRPHPTAIPCLSRLLLVGSFLTATALKNCGLLKKAKWCDYLSVSEDEWKTFFVQYKLDMEITNYQYKCHNDKKPYRRYYVRIGKLKAPVVPNNKSGSEPERRRSFGLHNLENVLEEYKLGYRRNPSSRGLYGAGLTPTKEILFHSDIAAAMSDPVDDSDSDYEYDSESDAEDSSVNEDGGFQFEPLQYNPQDFPLFHEHGVKTKVQLDGLVRELRVVSLESIPP